MIAGEHIRLRAISKDDLPDFVTWINDPEVYCNLTVFYPHSFEQEEKWYEEILTHPVEEHPLAIEIREKNAWKLVGDISFLNFDQRERSAEVSIVIGEKNARDKDYDTEAMHLMVRHGFLNLNLNRIYLRVFETNKRGIRCYEKVGFKHEGRLREARYQEGHYIDILMMSILKNEWMKDHMKEGNA